MLVVRFRCVDRYGALIQLLDERSHAQMRGFSAGGTL
jgi:hypothetical protein